METPYVQLRVYLVENSAILLNLLMEMLEHMTGVSIVGHSASATTAISEISALVPDVVIVDIALQSGNGFDVLKTLAPGGKRPVRIVLTNYATPEVKRRCVALGADAVFDKSTEIEELIECVLAYAGAANDTDSSPT